MTMPLFGISDEDSNISTIRKKIQQIKQHIRSDQPLKNNPLEDINFSSFASRSHLYYYRALAYLNLANNITTKQKVTYLNNAVHNLKRSLEAPYANKMRVNPLLKKIQKGLIKTASRVSAYRLILRTVEDLSKVEQKSNFIIAQYANALFHTGQLKDLERFIV